MTGPVFVQSYVAFLDILGFSEIVKKVASDPGHADLSALFRCHQKGSAIVSEDTLLAVTQFSDSVIISLPFDQKRFSFFCNVVGDFQRLLLREGFLCRGGVSRGEHFSNGSFLLSSGLVDAHRLESAVAKYPRVAVSRDLIDLVDKKYVAKAPLRQEDDGVLFVDYLSGRKVRETEQLKRAVERKVTDCMSLPSPSVREKGVWLAAYSDFCLGTALSKPRFS